MHREGGPFLFHLKMLFQMHFLEVTTGWERACSGWSATGNWEANASGFRCFSPSGPGLSTQPSSSNFSTSTSTAAAAAASLCSGF